MEPLVIFALAWLARSAWDHMRADYTRSRDAFMGNAAKKAGGTLPPDQHAAATRHHARGYIAREVAGGFPAARTGLRLGWLAHRAAVTEAKLQHADVRDTADSLRDQVRQRREARRTAQEQAITEGNVPHGAPPAEAAQTADEVAAARERRRQKEAEGSAEGSAPYSGGTSPGPVPPLPADTVKRPGPRRDATCKGTGADPDGPHQCPECRGFGTGPGDPDGPEVPDGICTACGNAARPGDPVIQEPNGRTHRSHILADIENREALRADGRECVHCGRPLSKSDDGWSHEACERVNAADDKSYEVRDDRDLETAEADLRRQGKCSYQIQPAGWEGPGVYCGREAGVDDPFCPEHRRSADGDDEGAARVRAARTKRLLRKEPPRDAVTGSDSPSKGDTVPATDTTYYGVHHNSESARDRAEAAAQAARQAQAAAMNDADAMTAAGVDAEVIDAQMTLADLQERAAAAQEAVLEQTGVVKTSLTAKHGGMQEATDNSPGAVATREFHSS